MKGLLQNHNKVDFTGAMMNINRKIAFGILVTYILVCCVIYGLTFIPALELCLPLYRGNNAIALAQAVLSFIN